jgi:hypothetical protein
MAGDGWEVRGTLPHTDTATCVSECARVCTHVCVCMCVHTAAMKTHPYPMIVSTRSPSLKSINVGMLRIPYSVAVPYHPTPPKPHHPHRPIFHPYISTPVVESDARYSYMASMASM